MNATNFYVAYALILEVNWAARPISNFVGDFCLRLVPRLLALFYAFQTLCQIEQVNTASNPDSY